jgi:hypothetical protein
MRHSFEVSGPASVALAWERYADPALWSTWAPQIRRVTWRGGERLAPGLTGVVHAIAGVNVPFEVTAVDAAAHDWSWIVRPLGVTLRMRHTLGLEGRHTRAGLEIEGPLLVVLGYSPVAQFALRRLLAAGG